MLPSGPTLRHALVIGVDGVRFDLPGPDTTPSIWAAAAGPGIDPGGPPAVTRQEQIAPLVLAALGCSGA